jgi:hypothetical protein
MGSTGQVDQGPGRDLFMVGMPRPVQGIAAGLPALSFAPTPLVPTRVTPAPRVATESASPQREIYSAGNRELPMGMLGKLVRSEGDAPTGDAAVDQAYDNAGIVYNFFKQVLGRNSLDDRGMKLKSTVHFGTNYNNAYCDRADCWLAVCLPVGRTE